jgi:hypothetical protein
VLLLYYRSQLQGHKSDESSAPLTFPHDEQQQPVALPPPPPPRRLVELMLLWCCCVCCVCCWRCLFVVLVLLVLGAGAAATAAAAARVPTRVGSTRQALCIQLQPEYHELLLWQLRKSHGRMFGSRPSSSPPQ